MNEASAIATGQLPDKRGKCTQMEMRGYLIPTAEVPVTNFYRDEIFEANQLPIYRCAYTPVFGVKRAVGVPMCAD